MARGEDGPESDIDLLVELTPSNERSELLRLVALSHELSEIVGYSVDVSTTGSLKPEILEMALRDAAAL
jgi:predicted nucleotidyltransferase